jgi:dephospho-CoA kinase
MNTKSPNKPLLLGLTGSIGMGKSTVAAMFRENGIPVFDADAEVHRLQGPQGDLLPEIESAFPGSTNENGVDRQALGAMVLGNNAKLQLLESIVHPAVAKARSAFLAAHQDSPMVVFDIPLLFEKGGSEKVDIIVVVSATADLQKSRVLRRPGMTPEKFAQIVKLQTPDVEKRARADFIIDTNGPLETTRNAVRILIGSLTQK